MFPGKVRLAGLSDRRSRILRWDDEMQMQEQHPRQNAGTVEYRQCSGIIRQLKEEVEEEDQLLGTTWVCTVQDAAVKLVGPGAIRRRMAV